MSFEVNPVSVVLRPLRKFAACVRRHGVTGLSDPKVVGGKVVLLLPRGLTAKSLRLKAAERACQKLLPRGANTQAGTGTGPTTTRPRGLSRNGPVLPLVSAAAIELEPPLRDGDLRTHVLLAGFGPVSAACPDSTRHLEAGIRRTRFPLLQGRRSAEESPACDPV
jgi:hypothetical protein